MMLQMSQEAPASDEFDIESEAESDEESGSDLDGFIVPDDFVDSELQAHFNQVARAAVNVGYPTAGKELLEEWLSTTTHDQPKIDKIITDQKAANMEDLKNAMSGLENRLETGAIPRRLALAMALHPSLGAESPLKALFGNPDVLSMICKFSDGFAVMRLDD